MGGRLVGGPGALLGGKKTGTSIGSCHLFDFGDHPAAGRLPCNLHDIGFYSFFLNFMRILLALLICAVIVKYYMDYSRFPRCKDQACPNPRLHIQDKKPRPKQKQKNKKKNKMMMMKQLENARNSKAFRIINTQNPVPCIETIMPCCYPLKKNQNSF